MKINFSAQINFNSLAMYKSNGAKIPEDFICRANDREKTSYNVSIKRRDYIDGFEVRFNNKKSLESIADEEFMIRPEIKYMYVDNMFTDDDKRGSGLGTCMHLINIVQMLENDLDRIELTAASTAIPFHTKLGFKPNCNCNNEYILKNIKTIAYDTSPELSQYSEQAKQLLKTRLNLSLKNKLANKIMLDYTKAAIKIMSVEEQQYLFPHCIDMTLTRKDVLKNNDFYNKLFDKYHIDYQITDSSDY